MVYLAFISCLLCSVTLVFSECERGWFHHGNSCYYISDTKRTWTSAASFCKAFHSQLADVQTSEENTFLIDTIEKIERYSGTVHDYWIDGTDEIIEGYWVWASTGKPISFTNWVHNEPNNVHGNEDCLEIGNWNKVGTWNDAPCSVEENFICEMEYPASGSIIGK